MLQLVDVVKNYKIGDKEFTAVDGISLEFKSGEFVAILGPSGCGKTTTLNIIGGLDRYTSGDLVINGKSTKEFKDADWDAYRNNSIGFIFQSYNLINHISVLANVEMALTLSGISKSEREARAKAIIERVGLSEHINKKPTLLSGGQKQRVAIARALINNPDLILADEPTGALDSKTSTEIMELIKEISKDKLVIMVTHAPELCENYATRTVRLKDGKVVEDTKVNPKLSNGSKGEEVLPLREYDAKKTKMTFVQAIKLSGNNIRTKLKRTTITALASSVGIVGLGLVMAVSNGFGNTVNQLEQETLVGLPINITDGEQTSVSLLPPSQGGTDTGSDKFDWSTKNHINEMTEEYSKFIDKMNPTYRQLVVKDFGFKFEFRLKDHNDAWTSPEETAFRNPLNGQVVKPTLNANTYDYLKWSDIENHYTKLAGNAPSDLSNDEVVFIVNKGNKINEQVAKGLGLDTTKEAAFTDILNKKIYVPTTDQAYENTGSTWSKKTGVEWNQVPSIKTLTIVGVYEESASNPFGIAGQLLYQPSLKQEILEKTWTGGVAHQMIQDINDYENKTVTINNEVVTVDNVKDLRNSHGGNITVPKKISIFAGTYANKANIKTYLDKWNADKADADKMVYIDLAEAIGSSIGQIIDMISIVLMAFASISLVVSSVMIGIIIYISVLERTREIGVLRALGARKKDITRVFNAESIIIGAFAGLLGITITILLSIPLNLIIGAVMPDLSGVVSPAPTAMIGLVILSIVLTFVGGFIPSKIASRKDPVEALRAE